MSRRLSDIVETYRTSLEWDDGTQTAQLLTELQLAVSNQVAQERAEDNAYTTCGACGRLYNEAEWNKLAPGPSGLHRRDDHDLSETRICSMGSCKTPLVVVLETYAGYPHKGSRREPMVKTDKRPSWCGACDKLIHFGSFYVAYWPRNSGLQQSAPQTFCESCDATARLRDK